MAHQILDLDALVDRPTVLIRSAAHPDGRHYEMRRPDEFGVLEHQRFQTLVRDRSKIEQIPADDQLTEKQAKLLTSTLDRIVDMILTDAGDVLGALSDMQKARIVEAFVGLIEGDAGDPPSRPTGAS